MTFQPSPQQVAYFDWLREGQGNAIIEAVAGAGKTTTLVRGLDHMDGKVFLGAYNTKMARELQDRTAGLTGVYAKTFHAAGFGALQFAFKRKWDSREQTLTGYKVKNMVKAWVEASPDRRGMFAIIDCVADIVSMAKQRGFGIPGLVDHTKLDNWREMVDTFDLGNALPEGHAHRIQEAINLAYDFLGASTDNLDVIDFDDMVYLPLAYDIRTLTHDYVLIDEAQDTNPTRRALAKKLLSPGGRVIAVGDPRQAIFGFTGADNDALAQIESEFGDVTRLPLTVTYRCPKAVVAHAQNWVDHIRAHESAPTGIVREVDFADLLGEVKPADAIICRFNKPLAGLYFKLIRAGVPAKVEGKDLGAALLKLANRWKVKTLNELEHRLAVWLTAQKAKSEAQNRPELYANAADQVDTLLVLMSRARELGKRNVADLHQIVADMFADDVPERFVILSSVHKAKGLEWNRVFLLGRREFMPAGFAKLPWQKVQEDNLIYVAVTRAKVELVEVINVMPPKRQEQEAA